MYDECNLIYRCRFLTEGRVTKSVLYVAAIRRVSHLVLPATAGGEHLLKMQHGMHQIVVRKLCSYEENPKQKVAV